MKLSILTYEDTNMRIYISIKFLEKNWFYATRAFKMFIHQLDVLRDPKPELKLKI